jgi:hypothetical protein
MSVFSSIVQAIIPVTALVPFLVAPASAAEFRAGVARTAIPLNASFRESSNGPDRRVYANAIAIEDRNASKIVLIATEQIPLARSVVDAAMADLQKKHGLDRSRVLFHSSHTVAASVVWPNGRTATALPPEQKRIMMEYRNTLARQLSEIAGAALQNLTPAEIDFGTDETGTTILRFSRPDEKAIALLVASSATGDDLETTRSQ